MCRAAPSSLGRGAQGSSTPLAIEVGVRSSSILFGKRCTRQLNPLDNEVEVQSSSILFGTRCTRQLNPFADRGGGAIQLHPDLGRGAACFATPSAQFRAVASRACYLPPAAGLNPSRLANLVCGLLPPHTVLRPTPLVRGSLGSSRHWCTNLRAASNLACDLHPAKRGSAHTTASFVAPFAGPCRDGPRR